MPEYKLIEKNKPKGPTLNKAYLQAFMTEHDQEFRDLVKGHANDLGIAPNISVPSAIMHMLEHRDFAAVARPQDALRIMAKVIDLLLAEWDIESA